MESNEEKDKLYDGFKKINLKDDNFIAKDYIIDSKEFIGKHIVKLDWLDPNTTIEMLYLALKNEILIVNCINRCYDEYGLLDEIRYNQLLLAFIDYNELKQYYEFIEEIMGEV